MTSRNPFRIGQRVAMTQYAVDGNLFTPRANRPHGWRGTVVRLDGPLGVRVHRDGYKKPTDYHVGFWRPLKRTDRAPTPSHQEPKP